MAEFHLEDFVYSLKFSSIEEKSPLLRDVLKSLQQSLTSVITDLQKIYYDSSFEEYVRHIYISFESSDFTKSGISTGNYLLTEPHRSFESHAKLIANHSLDILKNMLVSYQHLKLDEKFSTRITVLRYVASALFGQNDRCMCDRAV